MGEYITIQNGYTLATDNGLQRLNAALHDNAELAHAIRANLRIGVQQDTEVTGSKFGQSQYSGPRMLVSQAYASAPSVSYSGNPTQLWEPISSLILDAAYEATIYARRTQSLPYKAGWWRFWQQQVLDN